LRAQAQGSGPYKPLETVVVPAVWEIRMPDVLEEGIETMDDFVPLDGLQLPQDSQTWTRFERDLYIQSEGLYNPAEMAQKRRIQCYQGIPYSGTGSLLEVRGRVSVVTPSMSSRQHYHEQLWECFAAQTWPDKELIVVETYDTAPSAFLQKKAQEDSRLVFISLQREAEDDFNVGLKRDMTLHLATGEYIVNFDDDDIYAATYISRMVGEMQEKGFAAMTLSSWYNYFLYNRFTISGVCGYSDPDCWGTLDKEELDEILYGYGFSYVHERRIALAHPYPNFDFAEDAPFFLRLRELLGDSKVALKKDEEGICMHIMHRDNSTDDCEFSRRITPQELLDLEVSSLPLFQRYLDMAASAGTCWIFRPLRPPTFTISLWRCGNGKGSGEKSCL
jgi:glycosyltransferase involved in cell wall biosynthesis